jgi:hypothetical protein
VTDAHVGRSGLDTRSAEVQLAQIVARRTAASSFHTFRLLPTSGLSLTVVTSRLWRLTFAMSGRETVSEAPLLNGPLDCGVGRLPGTLGRPA